MSEAPRKKLSRKDFSSDTAWLQAKLADAEQREQEQLTKKLTRIDKRLDSARAKLDEAAELIDKLEAEHDHVLDKVNAIASTFGDGEPIDRVYFRDLRQASVLETDAE
jgi:septal ring factor EnvC (AmiA/AmiB activator)